MVYDTAIIGTGPAGLSAALNLKIMNKNFIWLGSRDFSPKVQKAEQILNYPGLPRVNGEELMEAFRRHVEDMELTITEQMVNSIMEMDGIYSLMAGSDFYDAKTILLTTGVNAVGRIPGEADFLGKGVSYCATCDGMLYRGKTIAVLSSSQRFEHEVKYLAELAAKVYYFPRYLAGIKGEVAAAQVPDYESENLEVLNTVPAKVLGENRVEALSLKDGTEIPIDGMFCLRDAIALSALLPGLATEKGHIVVDRRMATNLPGCFAAGDCTGRPYQYAKAVGEGNIAAHSIAEYLANM